MNIGIWGAELDCCAQMPKLWIICVSPSVIDKSMYQHNPSTIYANAERKLVLELHKTKAMVSSIVDIFMLHRVSIESCSSISIC